MAALGGDSVARESVFKSPTTLQGEESRRINRIVGTVSGVGPALGLLDTTAMSVANVIGMAAGNPFEGDTLLPGFLQPYHNDRDYFQAVGDIAGVFAIGATAPKLVTAGGAIDRVSKAFNVSQKAATRFAINTQRTDRFERMTRLRDVKLAAEARARGLNRTNFTNDPERMKQFKKLRNMRLKDAGKAFVASEIAIMGTLNQSEILFGESMDLKDVLVGSAFGVLPLGGAAIAAGRASRVSQSRALAAVNQVDDGQGGFAQGFDAWTGVYKEAERFQVADDAIRGMPDDDQALRQEAGSIKADAALALRERVRKVAKNDPFKLRSEALTATPASRGATITTDQADLLGDVLVKRPHISAAMSGVAPVTDLPKLFSAQAARLKEAQEAGSVSAADEILNHTVTVVERDGSLRPAVGRRTDYRDAHGLELARDGNLRDGLKTEYDHAAGRVKMRPGVEPLPTDVEAITELAAHYEALLQTGRKTVIKRPENYLDAHWTHIDALHEQMRRGVITSEDTGMTTVQLQRLSVDQKMRALREITEQADAQDLSPVDVSKLVGWRLHDDAGDFSPAGEAVLIAAAKMEGRSSTLGSINEVAAAVTDAGWSGINAQRAEIQTYVAELLSNAPYQFNTRVRESALAAGEAVSPQPVAFVNRATPEVDDTKRMVEILSQEAVEFRQTSLAEAPGLIGQVIGLTRGNRVAYEQAKRVDLIHSDSLQYNSLPIFTREFKASQNPAISAANRIATEVSRAVEQHIASRMGKLEELANYAMRRGNEQIIVEEDAYAKAFNSGQSLKADLLTAGRNQLDLRDPQTKQLIEDLFPGRIDLMQTAHVFDIGRAHAAKAATGRAVYHPIEFSEEAAQLINTQIELSYETLKQQNILKSIGGGGQIKMRKGHIMPKSYADKEMVFFREGAEGRITQFVAGKTKAEAERLAARALDRNPKLARATELSIAQYKEYVDEVFSGRLRDFSDAMRQTGPSKGRGIDESVNYTGEGLRERMVGIREAYRNVGSRALQLEFEQALTYARQAHAQSGFTRQSAFRSGPSGENAVYSPWDEYSRLLTGNSSLPPGSMMGKLDDLVEHGLEAAFTQAAKLFGVIGREGRLTSMDEKVANELLAGGANFQPFNSLSDALSRVEGAREFDGADVQRTLQQVNKVIATAALRFLGFGHALLNVTSLASTSPAIARRMVRNEGETVQEWQDRIGPIADYLDEDLASINPSKLMAEGIEAMYSSDPEMKAAYEAAAARGFFDAKVLEDLQQTIYEKPSDFKDFMAKLVGSQTDRDPRGGIFTRVSDDSEVLSRRLAWGMGYRLSTRIGRRDLTADDHHAFAHWFANQTIANYDPKVRPDMFRGTAGIPAGLFQTFVLNYMQRGLEMVATKDRKALQVQLVAQAATFGANSLPGYEIVAGAFGNTSDMDANLTDRMYKELGKDTADLLFAGTFSNIPKIFGTDGLGIYTRGQIAPTIPTLLDYESLPVYSITRDAMVGITQAVKEIAVAEQVSPRRLAEIIASVSPIRSVKSLTEVVIGESYNRNGDLISDDTRTPISVLARILNSRPLNETRQMDAFFRNSRYDASKRKNMRALGNVLVSRLRAGGDPEKLAEEFMERALKYTSEKGAKSFVKNRMEKSEILKILREIKKRDTLREDGSFVQALPMERLLGLAPAPGAHD